MNEIVYLQIKQNIEVNSTNVKLGDVADILSTNSSVASKLKTLTLIRIKAAKSEKICFSVMKVVELIDKEYPGITINNLGETEFVVDYIQPKKHSKWVQILLIAIVCIITFLGSAYGIMAYNNDVSTQEIFEKAYNIFNVTSWKEYMLMEISYAAGLSVGIIVFYNHFGNKHFTNEPSPLEVEMDKYDKDVNTALIDRRDAVGKEKK